MNFKKIFFTNSFYKRTIFNLFLVVFLVLILLLPIYQTIFNSVEENLNNKYATNIETNSTQICDILNNMTDSLQSLYSSNINKVFILNNIDNADYYRMNQISSSLNSICAHYYPLIRECIVFNNNNQVIFTKKRTHYSYDSFYGYFLSFDELTIDDWKVEIHNKSNSFSPIRKVKTADDGNYNALTYNFSILDYSYDSKYCNAQLIIDAEELNRRMALEENEVFFISDSNGNLLYHNSNITSENAEKQLNMSTSINKTEINNKDFTLFHFKDDRFGLNFYTGVPEETYSNVMDSAKQLVLIYIIFAFSVAAIISIFIGLKQCKPIKRLVEIVSDENSECPQGKNDYEFLEDTFYNMKQQNSKYYEKIQKLNNAINTSIFEQLIFGFCPYDEDKNSLPEYWKNFSDKFRLIMIHIINTDVYSSGNNHSLNSSISENINLFFGPNSYTYDMGQGKFILMIPASDNNKSDKEVLLAKLTEFKQKTLFSTGLHVFTSISNVYSRLSDVATAFNEIKFLQNLTMEGIGDSILFFDDANLQYSQFNISVQSMNLLANTIMSSNAEKTLVYMNNILNNNLYSEQNYKQLFYVVRGTLISVFNNIKDSSFKIEIPNYDIKSSQKDMSESLIKLSMEICSLYSKVSDTNLLFKKILNYINENYSDANLYGKNVAEKFGISEKYLYTFFKKNMGISFGNYLENIRLKKATDLIMTSNITITEIASQTGFNSQNTFYKAFKRVYNTTPRKFKTDNNIT